MDPVEPWNAASPKEKTPPSEATSQYPLPVGVAAIPTIGLLSGVPPMEPKKPVGATELPATLTVAPETAAPAESFTQPEIRPPVVAALGRIVRGPEDGPAPTATAKRAD